MIDHGYLLYFAYGSNLSLSQMNFRCPSNSKIGIGVLEGFRWIISKRGYANVVKSSSDFVLGVVYKITKFDKSRLSAFEGVHKRSYDEKQLEISIDGVGHDCLIYIDPIIAEGIPDENYISKINNGIRESQIPQTYVKKYLRNKIYQ
jgi:gamma-glutamylcyclotransferase (GGCT)/AIG2-like uncharacterized protein YtfP